VANACITVLTLLSTLLGKTNKGALWDAGAV